MQPLVVVCCGLPGTGKTTAAKCLEKGLEGFDWYDTHEFKRWAGYKRYSRKSSMRILEEMYGYAVANSLRMERGAIFEASYETRAKRAAPYRMAEIFKLDAIVLECICLEEKAKERMKRRSKNDGKVATPRDPKIYDRIKGHWEDTVLDLERYPDVSIVRYNTDSNAFVDIRIKPGLRASVECIKTLLTSHLRT